MKLKSILPSLSILLLAACNSEIKEPASTDKVTEAPEKKKPETNCYRFANPSDTILLNIKQSGVEITGTLDYILAEKDRNRGTIKGKLKGDILVANYTFMSEGVESVREVAFKLKDNTFAEGYGEAEMKDGIMKFKSLDSLNFNDRMQLIEIPCE